MHVNNRLISTQATIQEAIALITIAQADLATRNHRLQKVFSKISGSRGLMTMPKRLEM